MGSRLQVTVGGVPVGGGAPVVVQSMTTTRTGDVEATLSQIRALATAGAALVRAAVPNTAAAEAMSTLVSESPVPLIADVHFDHRLAVAALRAGAAGVRINPGNIGGRKEVAAVVEAARERGAVIRVGVNSGSLQRDLRAMEDHDPAGARHADDRGRRDHRRRRYGDDRDCAGHDCCGGRLADPRQYGAVTRR